MIPGLVFAITYQGLQPVYSVDFPELPTHHGERHAEAEPLPRLRCARSASLEAIASEMRPPKTETTV